MCDAGDEHGRGECELKGKGVEYIPGGAVGDGEASSGDIGGERGKGGGVTVLDTI